MKTFLGRLAEELLQKHNSELSNITIVLPNRRARVFLTEQFRKQTEKTIFAPDICSIQEFVQRLSGIRQLDNTELLFEFFKVYTDLAEPSERQTFDRFAPWAKVLLKDFSDIDICLLNPDLVLSNLKDIKDTEYWSPSEKRTQMIERYLKFWSMLPKFYHGLSDYLISHRKGYQGLVYKEASHKTSLFIEEHSSDFFVFAGFNALSPSEEKIIKQFLETGRASVYWDIDRVFIDDAYNQAGYFIRKIQQQWSYYKSHPFEWVFDEFSGEKNIQVIATSKSVGQAKIVGELLEKQLIKDPESIDKTALILSEKTLLVPILRALPEQVKNLNITLEYAIRNHPLQFLLSRLLKMQVYARSGKNKDGAYYYKDVIGLLSNPFSGSLIRAKETIRIIKENNITFITPQRLSELYGDTDEFFRLMFDIFPDDALQVLDRLSALLMQIKNRLDQSDKTDRISLAFTYELYKTLNKLKNYFSIAKGTNLLSNLYAIYRQIIDSTEVAFEGEPLSGLQIMGILESRMLDFETVIFTSANEGKLPFGKTSNSFIPYDVKRHYGIQTYYERDAIYAYHFYRLIQRAKNVILIYNSESEGLDSGEKSRFITQLKIENRQGHYFSETIYNAILPDKLQEKVIIEKSDLTLSRLREIAEKGFSPSALSAYVYNPLEFYYQRVLRIDTDKEVEETIEANTLGDIIHATLEELYKPSVNKLLKATDIEQMETDLEQVLTRFFKENFKEGDIKHGKNLLVFEAAKRSLLNFLNYEKKQLLEGDMVKILYLEHKFERILDDHRLPFPIKIAGIIDRIEERNGQLRILDYKTGKVIDKNLQITQWEDVIEDPTKNKIIQLLCYVLMYETQTKLPIETGIISFKTLKSGFLPFGFFLEKKERSNVFTRTVTPELREGFYELLIQLLLEIFDLGVPFQEKEFKN